MLPRASGVLLHITSLPGAGGVGSLGDEAFRFADFLAAAGQRYWQILPLTPTGADSGHSPYSSVSAFAGNPLLISVEGLLQSSWLGKHDARAPRSLPTDHAAFRQAERFKQRMLRQAFEKFQKKAPPARFECFVAEQSWWLDDYALFVALRGSLGDCRWVSWPAPLRDRHSAALKSAAKELHEEIRYAQFVQWVFATQWAELRKACRERSIQLIGDVPIYVRFDSSDVWAHRDIFKLKPNGQPIGVAGVPPDYFSSTGQLWGNPVYRWNVLKKQHYRWWRQRLARAYQLSDILRIDHFRGLVRYWEVPAKARTAKPGRWMKGPGADLFKALARDFPDLPMIAEDLGMITPDVHELMEQLGLPGIRVLLFAFGKNCARSIHAPHSHDRNTLVCSGTHDNNTARGWFEAEASRADKSRLEEYVGRKLTPRTAADELVRLAMNSVADLAVIPMQDWLRLGKEARFNLPGSVRGNWTWRMQRNHLTDALTERVRGMTELYGRSQPPR